MGAAQAIGRAERTILVTLTQRIDQAISTAAEPRAHTASRIRPGSRCGVGETA
jgi:hypothetical protein